MDNNLNNIANQNNPSQINVNHSLLNEPAQRLYSEDKVLEIINKRRSMSITGLAIINITIVSMAYIYSKDSKSLLPIILSFLIFNSILGFYFIVNSLNCVHVKPSYRLFNKYMYLYLSYFVIVSSIFSFFSNMLSFSNPMNGYKDPDALSRGELATNAAVSLVTGAAAATQVKPSKYIENYFKGKYSVVANRGSNISTNNN